jgi:hypothetical protein
MATILNLNPITKLTRKQFVELCQANPELQLERNPEGALIIMSPVGGESGKKESDLNFEISLWNRQTRLGVVFSFFGKKPHAVFSIKTPTNQRGMNCRPNSFTQIQKLMLS